MSKHNYTEIENFLKETILPELEKGRPDWDKPHAETTVQHMKKIIESSPKLGLDYIVLVISAYAHDWGYSEIFNDGRPFNLETLADAKPLHMEISAKKLRKLLENEAFSSLTKMQKDRAVELVRNHDKISGLKETDELVLMEADTLAALDVEKVPPTMKPESNSSYMESVRRRRIPKFISEYGKKEVEKLFKLREKYYQDKS